MATSQARPANVDISLMSPPAENARSPAPVMTATLTAPSVAGYEEKCAFEATRLAEWFSSEGASAAPSEASPLDCAG